METVQTQTAGQMVTARVGSEIYGLPIEVVEGIIAWEPLTKLPRTPAFLSGLLSVRGSILPVMDMRVKLDIAADPPDRTNRILILQVGDLRFGAIVDAVRSVEQLPQDLIERSLPLTSTVSEEFLDGIANLQEGMVLLLKPEGLLTEREQSRIRALGEKKAEQKAA